MKLSIIALTFAIVYNLAPEVSGHGALYEPPSRNSAWRFGFNTPTDYGDMNYNCGTYGLKYVKGQPYCGVCGNTNSECPNQPYCKKVIVRNYKAGQTVDVTLNLNANHGGIMQFRICPVTDDSKEVTWDCLIQHEMIIVQSGKTQYQEIGGDGQNPGDLKLQVKLPAGLTCKRCVFQWHWNGANYYGKCDNGTQGMGCGPQQTYIACADVSIS